MSSQISRRGFLAAVAGVVGRMVIPQGLIAGGSALAVGVKAAQVVHTVMPLETSEYIDDHVKAFKPPWTPECAIYYTDIGARIHLRPDALLPFLAGRAN